MESLILNIIKLLKVDKTISDYKLSSLIRASNKGVKDTSKHNAKKYLLPYYLKIKNNDKEKWLSWNVDLITEKKLVSLLKMKPIRSASGVATITVITKPWKCKGDCVFCPNDIRMPKSYIANEPACQRAERNFFDPYLQVSSRLKALYEMGHNIDKVEIIILGGTWNDYSNNYQRWFVAKLFEALNDGVLNTKLINQKINTIVRHYQKLGFSNNIEEIERNTSNIQQKINTFKLNYNSAYDSYYSKNKMWLELDKMSDASWNIINSLHETNSKARNRCVGLVMETRPAEINFENLHFMRKLGCTKVQIGVQSLDENKMSSCNRHTDTFVLKRSFELLRLFGFKIHAHFMANLVNANPDSDIDDYKELVTSKYYLPDEIKLYPCMLVESSQLNILARSGKWNAYSEDELTKLLAKNIIATPQFIRISRIMRDISSNDISQGVKKTNLRQNVNIVANSICKKNNTSIQEIRTREINLSATDANHFDLKCYKYQTSVTKEYFLQYTTTDNRLLGFLRLSLPRPIAFTKYDHLPINQDEAMIREVHVYGMVANIGRSSTNAQHLGLGKNLINEACKIAKKYKFSKINVISAIGTRQYYIKRGFVNYSDNKLYQQKIL